ncbi:MAG TPA: hypothetical protein VGI63_02555, partial [Verrucomicrobiae bacterium]
PALPPADDANGDGSYSCFNLNNITNVLAVGGGGGDSKNAVRPAQGNGGLCPAGSLGDTINLGGSGASANGTNQAAGGGGGSGGTGSLNPGNAANGSTGAPAVSGGGSGGNGRNSSNSGPGSPGNTPGGGGGGAAASGNNIAQLGGGGATGKVTITFAPTYTWSVIAGSNDWNVAANWTPNRTNPTTNDVLLFNQGGSSTATNMPTQTIGKLQVSSSTILILQPTNGLNILTIGEPADDALTVAGGSQLNISGSAGLTNLNINLATGAKGNISGSLAFSNNSAANDSFTLAAADAGGITFNSGATFTQNCDGGAFGSGTANSVVFAAGAAFIQKNGANPFQKSAPLSVVVFQAGSLFSIQANLAPSFAGRTYADLEINAAAFSQSASGSALLTISNLNVAKGALNLGMNQCSLKGGLTVAANATLNLNGTSTFTGTAEQIISGGGAFAFGPNAATTITNGATLTLNLQTNLALSSGMLFTNNGTFNIKSALTGTGAINGGGATVVSATGTLAPGTASTIGTLTFATAPALNGTNFLKINRNGGAMLADKIALPGGTLNYGGTLVVTNIGATLQPGDTFTNFSAASFNGWFSSLQLPVGYVWNTSQLPVNGSISIPGGTPPAIISVSVSGTSLVLNATNGTPNSPVTVLTSTSLALPLAQWTTNMTGSFDGSGNFNGTNLGGFNASTPQRFYLLQTQ